MKLKQDRQEELESLSTVWKLDWMQFLSCGLAIGYVKITLTIGTLVNDSRSCLASKSLRPSDGIVAARVDGASCYKGAHVWSWCYCTVCESA